MFAPDRVYRVSVDGSPAPSFSVQPRCTYARQSTGQSSSARGMRRPWRSSTLPKLAQTVESSSHYLFTPDLFRLRPVGWRRPQLCPGSGRVKNVRYGLLGLVLTTTTTNAITGTRWTFYRSVSFSVRTERQYSFCTRYGVWKQINTNNS